MIKVMYEKNNEIIIEPLNIYCERISKKNNSILYKLEEYLNTTMLSNDELKEIRSSILNVSAEIARLSNMITFSEDGDLK